MKIVLIYFCLAGFMTFRINAQIAGLSSSKLASVNSGVVGTRTIEFEPSCYFLRSVNTWGENGKRVRKFPQNDSAQYFSSLGLRFTYGLAKPIEIGAFMPVDLSGISLATKFNFLRRQRVGLAFLAGMNLNKISGVVARNSTNTDKANCYVGGIAGSFSFSDKLSVDIDSQLQRYFDKNLTHYYDLFADMDIGYYLIEKIQCIMGFDYSYANQFDLPGSRTLIINPGFTNELAKSFITVISFPVTIYGKNSDAYAGVTFALTITLQ